MGFIYAILIAGFLKKKKVNPKKLKNTLKKESKFLISLTKDLFSLTNKTFKFISKKLIPITKKKICQATVAQIKNDTVIDFTEYKLKKAK